MHLENIPLACGFELNIALGFASCYICPSTTPLCYIFYIALAVVLKLIYIASKTRKHLQVAGYRFFFCNHQNLTGCQPACLTTVVRMEAKRISAWPTFYNKLTSGMCLLGFRQVCALCVLSFLLSLISLVIFLLHEMKPYCNINFSCQHFP